MIKEKEEGVNYFCIRQCFPLSRISSKGAVRNIFNSQNTAWWKSNNDLLVKIEFLNNFSALF